MANLLSIVMSIIVFLLVIIFASSVNVHLDASKENQDNKVVIKIKMLYGLIRFKKDLNDIKLTEDKKEIDGDVDEDFEFEKVDDSKNDSKSDTEDVNAGKQIGNTIDLYKKYRSIINYMLNRTDFKILYWKTEIGFGDAALTGMSIGMINILKGNVYAMFNNIKIRPKKIYFKVVPNFNREILKTDIHSIFKVKIGYIIIAGLKYFWIASRKK